jgi:hypothetical protein
MQIVIGMLKNLVDSLDQIVVEETKQVLGVIRDLLEKLNGQNGVSWFEELKKFLKKETCWVMTVLQRLIAAGKYDYVNPNINDSNFPVPENFALGSDPKIHHFNRGISSEDVIRQINKDGYRPAMIWDLLDYGAKNPDEQRKYPIVALGSVGRVDGRRVVPCLGGDDSERGLCLGYWVGGWVAGYSFLAVRKEVSQTLVS